MEQRKIKTSWAPRRPQINTHLRNPCFKCGLAEATCWTNTMKVCKSCFNEISWMSEYKRANLRKQTEEIRKCLI